MMKDFDDLVVTCVTIGIDYGELLVRTPHEIKIISEGIKKRKELEINGELYIAHQGAVLNSLAVWGSDKFPNKAPSVKIGEGSKNKESNEPGNYDRSTDEDLKQLYQLTRYLMSGGKN